MIASLAWNSRRTSIPLCLLLLALSGPTLASYPEPRGKYVSDYAGLLAASEKGDLERILEELEASTGIEMTVAVIDSYRTFGTSDTSVERFATGLFNTWGVGRAFEHDGVLVLLARRDRVVRIELGEGFPESHARSAEEVIQEFMIPEFRQNRYGPGLVRGVAAMVERLEEQPLPPRAPGAAAGRGPALPAPPGQLEAPAPVHSSTSPRGASPATGSDDPAKPPGAPGAGWIAGLGAALAAVLAALGGGLARHRRRRCPDCGNRLDLLSEVDDDVYLDSGRKLEETLGSIDHQVWKCSHCSHHDVRPKRRLFSRFQTCPDCAYRTLEVKKEVLRRASISSSGLSRISRSCKRCDFGDHETVVLPRLTPSPRPSPSGASPFSSGGSSGGSTFGGGGRSSGGGASGRW